MLSKRGGTGVEIVPFEIRITQIFFRSALQLTYIILINIISNDVRKITKITVNHSIAIKVKIKVLMYTIQNYN